MQQTLTIGTYTQGKRGEAHREDGIFIYHFDPDAAASSGRLIPAGQVHAGNNPSFLAFHPDGRFLYAANELAESAASALAVDSRTGLLTLLNDQPTGGRDSCYVSLDPSGRWLLVANYSSGNLTVLPIDPDGRLGPSTDLVQHHGSGPNKGRQDTAHAHSIRFDPSGQFALAADLGTDRVYVYLLDPANGKLLPHDPPWVQARPGAGPRHMDFHRGGQFVYVANELDGTVASYTWNAQAGTLTPLEIVSTLPENFTGENSVADIHLAPAGDFLYVSNRGHNSIAGYRVDADSGRLSPLGFWPSGGNWPRNFAIDRTGRYLLAANQYSGNVVVFKIKEDGELEQAGEEISVPSPVCLLFR